MTYAGRNITKLLQVHTSAASLINLTFLGPMYNFVELTADVLEIFFIKYISKIHLTYSDEINYKRVLVVARACSTRTAVQAMHAPYRCLVAWGHF